MDAVFYIPARYNAQTGHFEILLFSNVAGNVYMSIDSDETMLTVIERLQQRLDALEVKENMTADADPTSADYIGYSPGSKWFNHSNGLLWVCKSINANTAEWTPMAAGAGN